MNETVITAKSLTKTYGHPWNKVEAVRSIDLEAQQGEIFGLLGPDGAGKTTTIQMLCGILNPTSGSARVAGVDVVKNPGGLGGKIGYMSEGFTLYGTLSVEENLDFFARLYKVPGEAAIQRKAKLLDFAHLQKARDRRAEHLSGGMKKKLALACALMYSPQVLFLDEPTTGVDPVSRRDFWLLLNDFLEQGITMFVSTPYMDEAERFHRVAFMHHGEIIACDTPAALKSGLPGVMIEALAQPQNKAVRALRSHSHIGNVQIFGDRLHLSLKDHGHELAAIQADLIPKGITLSEIHQVTPGLEDVYVAMMEKRGDDPASPSSISMPPEMEPLPATKSNLQYAISVSDLSRKFGGFTAVDNISFDVAPGEIFGFLGPNGSGKSTTIRMLCGLLAPSSGTGTVAGHDILKEQAFIKPDIGYMSQRFSLYNDLTVEENLDFYSGLYHVAPARRASRKRWVLEMAGLVGRERASTRTLSGGWKQRLALGCAILHEPSILFLDEPTSGVDPISRRTFWDMIYDLAQTGVTVFVTTHYMDEAEHCHSLALIYNGKIIASGSPSGLRQDMRLGDMLEVSCPEPLRALRFIQKIDGVIGSGLFGDRIHVLVEDTTHLAPVIQRVLVAESIPAARIDPIPFSLEDLFIVFIEMQDNERRAGS